MKDTIIEFTLNNKKHTYYRRLDIADKPLVTTNINNARKVNKQDVVPIVRKLFKEYGKDNIKNINLIKDDKN